MMIKSQLNNTFLERSYELNGQEGLVKLYVGKPQQISETEWYCEYQIVGIGDELIKKSREIDSIQGLLHVLHISPILLRSLADPEHKITFLKGAELMQ